MDLDRHFCFEFLSPDVCVDRLAISFCSMLVTFLAVSSPPPALFPSTASTFPCVIFCGDCRFLSTFFVRVRGLPVSPVALLASSVTPCLRQPLSRRLLRRNSIPSPYRGRPDCRTTLAENQALLSLDKFALDTRGEGIAGKAESARKRRKNDEGKASKKRSRQNKVSNEMNKEQTDEEREISAPRTTLEEPRGRECSRTETVMGWREFTVESAYVGECAFFI